MSTTVLWYIPLVYMDGVMKGKKMKGEENERENFRCKENGDYLSSDLMWSE